MAVKTYPYQLSQDPIISTHSTNFPSYPFGPKLKDSGLTDKALDTSAGEKEAASAAVASTSTTVTDSSIIPQDLTSKVNKTDYKKIKSYVAIPGTIVKTIIEFPKVKVKGAEDKVETTVFIELDDVMSLSYSVYRAKSPVTLLGQTSVDGYSLGAKTVAGSLIRSVFLEDNLTEFQSSLYIGSQKELEDRLTGLNKKIPSGRPLKETWSVMKDDLSVFNIHIAIVPENTYEKELMDEPTMKFESILGCIIINNGQVYSIQDLITESTFSFQAKTVKSTSSIKDFTVNFGSSPAFKSVSQLLEGS